MKRFGTGALLGWLLAWFLDPNSGRRRRHMTWDRTRAFVRRRERRAERAARGIAAETYGLKQKLTHLREEPKEFDDVTLARKVESEAFRGVDVANGEINVNAENGRVYLRGVARTPDVIDELVARTRRVQGVRDVENLLRVATSPNQEVSP